MNIKGILEISGTKAEKLKTLRRHVRNYERMKSTLAILHTWCKYDARRTTHEQIVSLIDDCLIEVNE